VMWASHPLGTHGNRCAASSPSSDGQSGLLGPSVKNPDGWV